MFEGWRNQETFVANARFEQDNREYQRVLHHISDMGKQATPGNLAVWMYSHMQCIHRLSWQRRAWGREFGVSCAMIRTIMHDVRVIDWHSIAEHWLEKAREAGHA